MAFVVAESFSEMQQLRYCLCMVSRAVSTTLAGNPTQTFNASLRRTLFDTFGGWCEEGSQPGRYRAEVSKMLAISRMRIKDPETARQYESDMAETADVVEHAAYLAMASVLLVGHPAAEGTLHCTMLSNASCPKGMQQAVSALHSAGHLVLPCASWHTTQHSTCYIFGCHATVPPLACC